MRGKSCDIEASVGPNDGGNGGQLVAEKFARQEQPRKTSHVAKMDGMLSVKISPDTRHVENNLVTSRRGTL